MPRLADHDQRRKQITDAARRVIARGGLGAATFQSVAADAGISVRLVQYYFGTKRTFLLATHQAVVADAGTRFTRRLTTLGADPEPRAVIRAILTELLPADAARREDAVVLNAFHAGALSAGRAGDDSGGGAASDGAAAPDVGAEDTLGAPRYLIGAIAAQLQRARAASSAGGDGGVEGGDTDLDAELILAAAAGLTQTLLVDASAAERADALLDRLLDRLVAA
ncbi:TetR/AcrR family transcriptional regulator [Promicromonospora kroppenstedtii]|uniref:TetR/AcrR family transcriptional regulator n=1 Tax=Promicromonospora kroppenstedtii TaxID=440482 RepID=UPI0004B91743|nr:TetR/AcrR family transcriptional regulator [Promicromonospora kroppenstedtii]